MAEINTKTKFGTDTSYTLFESDGTLVMTGDATVYDDLMVNISSTRLPAAGAPSWAAYKGGNVLSFPDANTSTLYFSVQLPHSYKLGSDIDFHIHVVHEGASAGFSTWQLTYCGAAIGGVFTTAQTSLISLTAPAVIDKHILGEFPDITGAGFGISSFILCSLERHGNSGTYNGNIFLVGLDCHIQMDTLGSRKETEK